MINCRDAPRRQHVPPCHTILDPEGLLRTASPHRMILNEPARRLRETFHLAGSLVQLLQNRAYGFGRRAWTSGGFETTALHDQERAFFLQPADRFADIGRVKAFFGMEIRNGQPCPCARCLPRRR